MEHLIIFQYIVTFITNMYMYVYILFCCVFVPCRDGRLQEGDQILAIDGQLLDANISHKQAIHILQQAKGLVEIVVARGQAQSSGANHQRAASTVSTDMVSDFIFYHVTVSGGSQHGVVKIFTHGSVYLKGVGKENFYGLCHETCNTYSFFVRLYCLCCASDRTQMLFSHSQQPKSPFGCRQSCSSRPL